MQRLNEPDVAEVALTAVVMQQACAQMPLLGPPFQRWNPRSDGQASTEFHRIDAGVMVRFPGLADFVVTGSGVTCIPVPGTGQTWRSLYEQQVHPLVLAHHGAPIFHGGAVVVDGGAVAFLAPSGRGKSTLTTAFARRGMPFLSDDCLQLHLGSDIMVMPQQAFVRLWEDSVANVAPQTADRIFGTGSSKPRVLAGSELLHCNRPMPLRAVYVIDSMQPAEPAVMQLSPAQALMAWTANAFVLDIKSHEVLRRTMVTASRLAHALPVSLLAYPRDYAMLDAVVATILADLSTRGDR